MSSTGTILETTPLLPWRPAILSPGCRRRLTAKYTLTILSTPAGSSSPCVSFLRFSSKARSKLWRVCSSEFLMLSNWVATSSSAGRMSNQWNFSTAARWALSIFVPLANFCGPPLATRPFSSFSIRSKASASTMRSWSFRSRRKRLSSSSMICWARLSRWMPSRVNTCTSITVPDEPWSTRSEVSFTSEAFSPKMARSSFSSGVSVVSPLGAHVDDAGLVQAVQLLLRQVRNVARDFFGAQLRVARHDHEFLDVDRGIAVFGHHAFGDQDRVFEVVAVPRHERDQHVLADGDFAEVRRCAVGDHVTLDQHVALLDDGALVDIGVLVGTLVLDEVVDVHTHFTGHGFGIVDADHDTGRFPKEHPTKNGRENGRTPA